MAHNCVIHNSVWFFDYVNMEETIGRNTMVLAGTEGPSLFFCGLRALKSPNLWTERSRRVHVDLIVARLFGADLWCW